MGWKSKGIRLALYEGIIAAGGTGSFLMLSEFGPWHWYGIAGLMALGIPFTYISEWRAWRKERRKRRSVARRTPSTRPGKTPMRGIQELERCHQEFVKYVGTPYEYPIGHREIAATQAFLPYVKQLCRILDEQSIPHPSIPGGLTFTGTDEWGRFMAELWAVSHDIEAAQRVYPSRPHED